MQTTFVAPDIECDGCVASIQKALGRLKGVTEVSVVVPTKTIIVQYEPSRTGPAVLAGKLTDIGFPPQPISSGTERVIISIDKA